MGYYNVKITRRYGPLDFSVDATVDLTPEGLTGTTASAQIEKVLTAVNAIHDHYAAQHAPKIKAVQTSSVEPTTLRTEKAQAVHKELRQGKRYFKVHGGAFSQYGVMIWPEQLKAADIEPDTIPDDGLTLTGMEMLIEMKDTKPWKVVKLQEASE